MLVWPCAGVDFKEKQFQSSSSHGTNKSGLAPDDDVTEKLHGASPVLSPPIILNAVTHIPHSEPHSGKHRPLAITDTQQFLL